MTLPRPPSEPRLRTVVPADPAVFFEHQRDPVARRMAAFTAEDPSDRAAFDAHWACIIGEAGVVIRSVVVGADVIGHVLSFEASGRREVSYWIARAHRGHRFATRALALFLTDETRRLLHARAASDNAASTGVLRNGGFVVCGADRGYAAARGEAIDESVFRLDA